MESLDIFKRLEFSQQWIQLGISDLEILKQLEDTWLKGEDPNLEHYRYGALKRFLESKNKLTAPEALALYDLGDDDPDPSMDGVMMYDILKRSDCPKELFEKALNSGRMHLHKIACRRLSETV
jgi:hypothetical protein